MVDSSDAQRAPIAELVPELDRLAVDAMADCVDELIFHQPERHIRRKALGLRGPIAAHVL
jgi:hypothetical protein